jgi:hypothetical protein
LLSRSLSLAGLVTLMYTSRLGGKMFFEHAAGVPTAALEPEIRDRKLRARGHHHREGEATDSAGSTHHDDHDADHEH